LNNGSVPNLNLNLAYKNLTLSSGIGKKISLMSIEGIEKYNNLDM
jgi:hypothetical protein